MTPDIKHTRTKNWLPKRTYEGKKINDITNALCFDYIYNLNETDFLFKCWKTLRFVWQSKVLQCIYMYNNKNKNSFSLIDKHISKFCNFRNDRTKVGKKSQY